jgi:uncharacterized protein
MDHTNTSGSKHVHQVLDLIVSNILEFASPTRIWLFGSRATGEARKFSDFDIALEGVRLDLRTRRELAEALDEKLGAMSVDLVELETVDEPLLELICQQGEVIYDRQTHSSPDPI